MDFGKTKNFISNKFVLAFLFVLGNIGIYYFNNGYILPLSEKDQLKAELNACGDLGVSEKDFCFLALAEKRQNENICFLIDSERFSALAAKCYIDIAATKKDSSLCDPMPVFRSDCYNAVAQSNKDISLCEKIDNQEIKAECLTVLQEVRNEKK